MKLAPLAAVAAFSFAFVSTAHAVPDHLQCLKIKDDIDKTGYTATITPDDPTFPSAAGCQIKLGAKLLCVDATKSAVVPAPPGAPDGAQPGKFFCYKAKCPVATPTFTGSDQFGTHNIEVKKTQFLCAPADTVTTTTTLPECTMATDCVGSDTQCQQRTCIANTCGVNNAPAGTQLMTQSPGDCQTLVCNGMGGTTSEANPMDVPNDGNDCTDDTCTGSTPANTPSATGTACASGGGTVCDGAGTCVQCNTFADCPGSDTTCQQRTCTANTCGVNFATAGTPAGGDTPGDCKVNVCDGTGGVTVQNDDGDLPVDGQDCTQDVCTAGVPSNPAQPQNLACDDDGGSVCNGSGQCVECNMATQCVGVDTECQVRSCTSGVCGVFNMPNGTSCTMGGTQCDGNGNCI